MKHIKLFEKYITEVPKIINDGIINFAKIYNKEKGYSNKSIFYNNNIGPGKYVSIAENPVDNFGYIIVGDLQLEKFIRNAKDDGLCDTLYMRSLTNKVNKKYGSSNVINVAIDGNPKLDITKNTNTIWDKMFNPIDDKQIVRMMDKETIIEENTLIVNKKGEIKTSAKGDS